MLIFAGNRIYDLLGELGECLCSRGISFEGKWRALIATLAKTLHKTIFLSTHDLEHALQIADQLWLLDRQNGLTTGSPAVLSDNGSVEKYFNRPGIHYDRQNYTFRIDKAFEATTTDPRK